MTPLELTAAIFGSMLFFMAVRFPIAISMFLAGAIGYISQAGWLPFANFVNAQTFARFAGYDLSVIPLFILMGTLLPKAASASLCLHLPPLLWADSKADWPWPLFWRVQPLARLVGPP